MHLRISHHTTFRHSSHSCLLPFLQFCPRSFRHSQSSTCSARAPLVYSGSLATPRTGSSNMACWKMDHLPIIPIMFLARNLHTLRGFSMIFQPAMFDCQRLWIHLQNTWVHNDPHGRKNLLSTHQISMFVSEILRLMVIPSCSCQES